MHWTDLASTFYCKYSTAWKRKDMNRGYANGRVVIGDCSRVVMSINVLLQLYCATLSIPCLTRGALVCNVSDGSNHETDRNSCQWALISINNLFSTTLSSTD